MSPTDLATLKKYFKRTRFLLRIVSGVLTFIVLSDIFSGMVQGLLESNSVAGNGKDIRGILSYLNASMSLEFNLLLVAIISYLMIDILKEFESGRFFNAKVLSNMRKIGIYTEIACYFFIPLAVVVDMPNLAKSDMPLQFVFSISYAGGAAGTFIRYFSKLIPIGRALEESYELTV